MIEPLAQCFRAEAAPAHGPPDEVLLEVDGDEVACAREVPCRSLGLWAGLGHQPREWHCCLVGESTTFRWSVHSERRGTSVGYVLALLEPGGREDRMDPLWTVGTLGRDRIPLPEGVMRGDAIQYETAFVTLTDGLRARHQDEDWAQLSHGPDGTALRLWNSRTLAQIQAAGARGWRVEVRDVRGPLETAMTEALPLFMALI